MGFRISTNVQSIAAQRTLGTQRQEANHQLEKLASGERIVRAADDAAGLAISEKFKAEIRSTRQAVRNTQDAISLIQVAEGGLNEIGSILIRMRELSIQSASDTIGDTERSFTDLEVQALKEEVNRIASSTRFNGVDLLKGEGPNLEFQVGTGPDAKRDRISYDVASVNSTLDSLQLGDASTRTRESSQMNLDKLDAAITKVSGNRAVFGAMQNRLQSTMNNLQISDENISAANSRIRDADIALETAELTKRNILTNAAVSTLAQANQNGMLALKLI
ncbi:MAG: flagellin [Bdellovibrionota bacterium]